MTLDLDLDPDRNLILAYVAARDREALATLWRLDVTLGAVLVTGRDPQVSLIRLAWWREALEALDHAPPPAEPTLQAVATHLLPRGLDGAALAALEEGWRRLVPRGPLEEAELAAYAEGRGATLFALSAALLGDPAADVAAAGRLWALVDLARHSRDPAEAARALAAAAAVPVPAGSVKPRPLAMLTLLARRDLAGGAQERPGAPLRMLRLLGHRLINR